MGRSINEYPKHIQDQLLKQKSIKGVLTGEKMHAQAVANVVDGTQGMNKTESRFYTYLRAQGDVVHIDFNCWRCLLAKTQAKDAWYKPDFFVIRDTGRIEIYEVKGFWRSRDRVRVKVAASLYPYFSWYGAMWENEWKFERF